MCVAIKQLRQTGLFQDMSLTTDEDEHSIEMHLPYIYNCTSLNTPLVPILVGALDTRSETEFGRVLAPYLASDENFFVISSDFCHWGPRFRYFYLPEDQAYGDVSDESLGEEEEGEKEVEIHAKIEQLDKEAMGIISQCDAEGFSGYLRKTRNTICGRHPISVLLRAVDHLENELGVVEDSKIVFTKYAQSNRVTHRNDNSVSYAAGYLTFRSVN